MRDVAYRHRSAAGLENTALLQVWSILIATVMGGVLSVVVASVVMNGLPPRWLPRMVGYSAGLLLGAATLSILPEAFESEVSAQRLFAVLLAGLLGFYALQKTALWRHDHDEPESRADEHPRHPHLHGHGHELGGGTVWSILVGDGFHNFVDGVIIAAAFLTDPHMGWATAIAVTAHEIPQEAGDFLLLRASGLSFQRALWLNALSGVSAVAGGLLGYVALSHVQGALPYMLVLAASSFLYVAIADLLPMLRREGSRPQVAWQTAALAAGLATAALLAAAHGA